jgi:MFS family permease
MAVGAFFYGLANLGIAFGSNFAAFWLCMVVMTIGELALVPTTSTYAANLAPVDQRARYMSLYGLTWSVASGIGPVFGGILSDHFGPKMIWYGGALVGVCSVICFLALERYFKTRKKPAEAAMPA